MKSLIKIILVILFSNGIVSCTNSESENSLFGRDIHSDKIMKNIASGKDIYIENCVINGDLDFTKIVELSTENVNMRCNYVEQSICFVNCTFNSNLVFSGLDEKGKFVKTCFERGVSFKNCIFKDTVIASNCEYRGIVDFSSSIFESKANFSASYFANKENYFSECSFNGELQFSYVKTNGNITFFKSFFKTFANFQNCTFGGNLMLPNSQFTGYTDFSNSIIGGIANFSYAEFSGNVILAYMRFDGRADFIKTIFVKKTEIKHCDFHTLTRFVEADFSGIIAFNNNVFSSRQPEVKNLISKDGSEFVFNDNYGPGNTSLSNFIFIEE